MVSVKDKKRTILILLALFGGGAVPIQFITLSFEYAQYVKEIPKENHRLFPSRISAPEQPVMMHIR